MRKSFILGTAAIALVLAPLAVAQSSFRDNGAMTMDSQRGVLTMAPLLERVTPAVVSIDILLKCQAAIVNCLSAFSADNSQMLSPAKSAAWARA